MTKMICLYSHPIIASFGSTAPSFAPPSFGGAAAVAAAAVAASASAATTTAPAPGKQCVYYYNYYDLVDLSMIALY